VWTGGRLRLAQRRLVLLLFSLSSLIVELVALSSNALASTTLLSALYASKLMPTLMRRKDEARKLN
jgi:hypothetical protein